MIAIIDYKAGNLTSVKRAVNALGRECEITRDLDKLARAERIIFPGVGAAGSAMADLRASGLDRALEGAVNRGAPVLGICLGAQIVLTHSEEDGGVDCLDLIEGRVKRFAEDMEQGGQRLKVPHMGWNRVEFADHPLFAGVEDASEFYFVHSYYPAPADEAVVIGRTEYGIRFASALARGSLVVCQFHLEKSGRPGLKILENFLSWSV